MQFIVDENSCTVVGNNAIVGKSGDVFTIGFSDFWRVFESIEAVWKFKNSAQETVEGSFPCWWPKENYVIPSALIGQKGEFSIKFFGVTANVKTLIAQSESIPLFSSGITESSNNSGGGTTTGDGLTKQMKNALDEILKLCAFTSDPSEAYENFKKAFSIGVDTDDPEPSDDSPLPTDLTKWLSFDSSIVQNSDSIVITSPQETYGKYVVAGLFKYSFADIKTKGFTINFSLESTDMTGALYGYAVSAASAAPADYSAFVNKTACLYAAAAGNQSISLDFNWPDWQPSTPSDSDYIFLRLEFAGTGTITIKDFSISEW